MRETLLSLLEAAASGAPESIAMLDADGHSISFKAFYSRCLNLSDLLAEHGIRRGDRVACAVPTGPAAAEALLAICLVATVVPIQTSESFQDVQAILESTRSKAILIVNKTPSEILSAAEGLHIPLIQPSLFEGSTPNPAAPAIGIPTLSNRRWTEPQPDDVALLVHSGSTDATSRQFPLTHRNLVTAARNVALSLRLGPSDRCLALAPITESHGLVGCLLASFSQQASVICPPYLRPNLLPSWLGRQKPTWISANPATYRTWLDRWAPAQDLPADWNLRFLRSASAPLAQSLAKQLEATFKVPVVDAYSVSEAGHQVSSTPLQTALRKPGSVGTPTGTRVAILDAAGQFLPSNQIGEIVVQGDAVATACLGRPDVVRHAFARGWLRTGDLGSLDADGYLFLAGRVHDVIHRGSERILPRTVEEVLEAYPGVAQAVCFPKTHPTLGDDLAAGVILRDGAVATEAGIRTFAFERLPLAQVPSRVLILERHGLGSNTPLRRNSLAQLLAPYFRTPHIPPRDDLEQFVAHIWEETLEVARIGVDDSFFGLGGDPIQASRVVSRVNELLQLAVPVATLLRHPTVTQFTNELKRIAHPTLLETLAQNVRDLGSLSRDEVFELLPPSLRRDERRTG